MNLTDALMRLTDAFMKLTDASVKLADASMRLTDAFMKLTDASVKLTDAFMCLMSEVMKLMTQVVRLMNGVARLADTPVDLVTALVRGREGSAGLMTGVARLTARVASHTDAGASRTDGVVKLSGASAWLTTGVEGFAGAVMGRTGLPSRQDAPPTARNRGREGSPPPACCGAMARRAMGYLLLLFTLALVGCDHATKAAAQAALGHRGPVALVPGVLDLHYAENRDTAFSLLRGVAVPHKGALLVAASAVGLLAVAIAWWRRRRSSAVEQAAFALLLAGAAGNAIDRIRAGYVVDFIEIHRWPIFNVADVAIVAGVALLLIGGLRRRSGAPPGVIR